MSDSGRRSIGFFFGLIGALLIILEGLADFIRSAFFLAVGRPLFAWEAFTASILFVILGCVLAGFALWGRFRSADRALASGVVMLVVSLLGILVLGIANELLGLLGAIFVLIGGLLYIFQSR